MSKAAQVVAEEITAALQSRIVQWQAERAKIEAVIQREDRKRQRYDLLGELIVAAEAEIEKAMKKVGDRDAP